MYLWDLDDGGFAGVVVLKKGACLLLALASNNNGSDIEIDGVTARSVDINISGIAVGILGLDSRLRGVRTRPERTL